MGSLPDREQLVSAVLCFFNIHTNAPYELFCGKIVKNGKTLELFRGGHAKITLISIYIAVKYVKNVSICFPMNPYDFKHRWMQSVPKKRQSIP